MTVQEKYDLYEKLLTEWNQKINLVAKSTLPDIRQRHIEDSAQLINFIPKDKTVIDLGSGAGFPAIVLAINGYKVISIESVSKKANFLNMLKTSLDLPNITIINDRVENVIKTLTKDKNIIITARAFAPLSRILDWTSKPNLHYILLKGQGIKDEIIEADTKYKFAAKLYKSATGDGFIVDLITK